MNMSTRKAQIVATVVVLVALIGAAVLAKQLLFSGAAVRKINVARVAESRIFELVNRQRRLHGLRLLTRDPKLDALAREHSQDMLIHDYFAHDAPSSAGGVTFASRFHEIHPHRTLGEENIAWGTGPYGTAGSLMHSWMTSPPHRENILNPGVRRVGIGVVTGNFQGQRQATIGTQDFSN